MNSKNIAKTQLLLPGQLKKLRADIQDCFIRRHPEHPPMVANTFLGSYEALRNDILRVLPELESSVSLTRLRKLFYYTNPEICPPKQAEHGVFGIDFLNALNLYLEKNETKSAGGLEKNQKGPAWRSSWRRIWLLAFPVVIASFFWLYQPAPEAWKEDFNDTSKSGLEHNGWQILDYDSTWLNRQISPGRLTLYTNPGDYWIKPHEKQKIPNMLVRKIGGEGFSVNIKIAHFNPVQSNHQVGLYLFDADLGKSTFIRATCEYIGPPYNHDISEQRVCGIYYKKNDPIGLPAVTLRDLKAGTGKADTVWIRMDYRNPVVQLLYKINYEWNGWGIYASQAIDFKPAYVGIGVCQGWTLDDGTPKGAEIIPALIEEVKFTPKTQ